MAVDFGDIDFSPGGSRSGGGPRRSRGGLDDQIAAFLSQDESDSDGSERSPSSDRASTILGDPSTFLNGAPYGAPYGSFYTSIDALGPGGSWSGWDVNRRIQLQLAMQAAGLLGDIDNLGVWNEQSQRAFEDLLTYANQSGVTWQDALTQYQQGAALSGEMGVGGSSGGRLDPTIITLPNPEDLNAALEQAGMDLTGERLDDDLRESATEALLDTMRTQQERALQRDIGRAGTGGTFVEHELPDANRMIEEEIRTRAPQKVMNKQTRDAMEVWFEMIGEPL